LPSSINPLLAYRLQEPSVFSSSAIEKKIDPVRRDAMPVVGAKSARKNSRQKALPEPN